MKTITTKYHGPTNTRGSRISASDGDNRLSISYPYELNHDQAHMKAARQLCEKLNWKGTLQGGSTKDGMVWCFIDPQDQFTV